MSEETQTTEETTTETVAETPKPGKNFEKLFMDTRKREDALKAKLADIESTQAEAAKAAKLAELEKSQNIDAIKAQFESDLKAQSDAHNAQLKMLALKDEFRKQACNDEYFIGHHIGAFDGDAESISEYVKGLVENETTSKYFGAPQVTPTGQPAPVHGDPAIRSTQQSLETRLKSEDQKVKMDALAERLAKQLSGELPVG
jgi:hypothetical protein